MSWLQSAGVEASKPAPAGCDFSMKTSQGGRIHVKVGKETDARPAVGHMFLPQSELTHRRRAVAIAAFQRLTVAGGYGPLSPPDRGVDPEKKLCFEDDFELVAMRHREFRKVPNPSEEELTHYDRVVSKAVARFMYINRKICARHGIESSDMKTYAQVWACNFLGLYKISNPQQGNDNERMLYTHLCQRAANFVEVLLKKERSCIPDSQTASVGLYGRPYESGMQLRRSWQEDHEASFEEALEDSLEDEIGPQTDPIGMILSGNSFFTKTFFDDTESTIPAIRAEALEKALKKEEAARRKTAQAALKEALGGLEHDRMVELLTEAMENDALCYDARQEARKQLRLHRAACESCAKTQEELAGAEALS